LRHCVVDAVTVPPPGKTVTGMVGRRPSISASTPLGVVVDSGSSS
jgi:hypothetical protein